MSIELKAVSALAEEHHAQVQNYLKATGFKLGILINFGHYPKAEVEQIVTERGRYAYRNRAIETYGVKKLNDDISSGSCISRISR